jgi:RNA polymerase sigma factor for flagellar operon FliA
VTPLTAQEHHDVERWLPLVRRQAQRLSQGRPGLEVDDLIQDGVFGLVQALRRFDPTRGVKFETFAEVRVRGAMVDQLRLHAWPRGLRAQRRAIAAAGDVLWNRLERAPTEDELAGELEISVGQLGAIRLRIAKTEGEHRADDRIEPELPVGLLPRERRRLARALAQLPARQRRVLHLYYLKGQTLQTISPQLGVNPSRVSQLHQAALRTLRAALGAPAVAPKTYRRHRPIRRVSCAA